VRRSPSDLNRTTLFNTCARPSGIARATGPDSVRTGPEQARGFHPHLTIAYSNAETDAAPYATALAGIDPPPAIVPITAVTLIRQDRQLAPHWLYRWTTEATAPLTEPAAPALSTQL